MPEPIVFLFIVISIVAVLFLASARVGWKNKERCAKELAALRDAWGKPIRRERDCSLLCSLWGIFIPVSSHYLDNQTWQDLNLDLIFEDIDRTYSLPGEMILYHLLRTPETHAIVLKDRGRIINLFQTDAKLRESIQLELLRLGRTRYPFGIVENLWGDLPPRERLARVLCLPGLFLAISLGTVILLGAYGLPWGTFAIIAFGVLWALNMSIHYRTRRVISERILSIRYLGTMVTSARRIGHTQVSDLEDRFQRLDKWSTAARRIPLATAFLVPERHGSLELVEMLQEYFAILFLSEVRAYYSVIEEIRKCRESLHGIFETLGELDSLQAIASFREGLASYATPDFHTDGTMLEIKDAIHPLLASPVPNSISLTDRGHLITGSNMSGKSTFLRTLGINVVLAQTVLTCPATAYRASLFQVITSLSQTDALIEGKSFYLVEAERLLTMIRSSEGSIPTLCIIDEILCGTNSAERLVASEEILRYLAGKNARVIAATHDIELVDRLTPFYSMYHFSDDVDDKGLHFDYHIRPGKATTTNAIRLLDYLGYPKEIVENARGKAAAAKVNGRHDMYDS